MRPRLNTKDAAEDATKQTIEGQIIDRCHRMGDDYLRNKCSQRVHGGLFIFIDIDHQMRGRKCANFIDVDVFGTANFRNARHAGGGMNAKAGAPNQLRR